MDKEIKTKNNYMDELKHKFETKAVDTDALKAKDTSIEKTLTNVSTFPEKMVLSGPVGNTSVKSSKKDENPLHGKDDKVLEV